MNALLDQSRAPLTHPHAIPPELTETLIAVRKKHRHWGPRKLIEAVRRLNPESRLPAASTVAGSTSRFEIDHADKPFAKGGRILKPEDGRLLCKPHNLQHAREFFGDDCTNRFTRRRR